MEVGQGPNWGCRAKEIKSKRDWLPRIVTSKNIEQIGLKI
jgi:hypothetical protein